MHAIAHGGITDTVREFALKVVSGIQIQHFRTVATILSDFCCFREKKPLPHLGLEPASVLRLAFQSAFSPTEWSPLSVCLLKTFHIQLMLAVWGRLSPRLVKRQQDSRGYWMALWASLEQITRTVCAQQQSDRFVWPFLAYLLHDTADKLMTHLTLLSLWQLHCNSLNGWLWLPVFVCSVSESESACSLFCAGLFGSFPPPLPPPLVSPSLPCPLCVSSPEITLLEGTFKSKNWRAKQQGSNKSLFNTDA